MTLPLPSEFPIGNRTRIYAYSATQMIEHGQAEFRRGYEARQPLTDEQIDLITREKWGTHLLGAMMHVHREFARAIEQLHGIGDKS